MRPLVIPSDSRGIRRGSFKVSSRDPSTARGMTYRGTVFSGAVGEGEIGIPIFDATIIALACCQPYQARLKRKNANTAHHADPAINPTIPRMAPPTRPMTLEICRLRISPNG